MQLPALHLLSAAALLLAPAVSACESGYSKVFCQCVEQTGISSYKYDSSATQQACLKYSMDHDNAFDYQGSIALCWNKKGGRHAQKICATEFHQDCPDGTSANCADTSNDPNLVH
ncbi:hypothetical protein Tdes44962_MAKER09927 [Teratosphaeria destructans]|uniref:Extracellular membrane protein CFEM domain-containing protein n=1 Tax=Teratosphaeria destructans TaxID=418781 RepID=A0A9W7W1Y3_9PEZI|nr:hypothetical protein Tdes44962_MAKER09927 [Teratosphaeria destructans]